MRQTWTYRWAFVIFSFVLLGCLIALPSAIRCCSQLGPRGLAFGLEFRARHGWFAAMLINWPAGFRLLVMTMAATAFCLLSTLMLYLIALTTPRDRQSWMQWTARFLARATISSFMVGVLFILSAWLMGFVGRAPGPDVPVVFLTASTLIALLEHPRLPGALLGLPLFVLGFLAAFVIMSPLGISFD